MSGIMSIAVSALSADTKLMEQYSINAANASTPGYKRSHVASLSFDRVMSAQAGASESSWRAALPVLQKVVDFTSGGLQSTGRNLDIAVEGKGFVRLTDGHRTWLTRTASMSVDAQGTLVGPKGLRVVGALGDITPGLAPGDAQGLTINAAGTVLRGEQVLGQIALVACSDETQLRSDDGVLFEAAPDVLQEAEHGQGAIRAGFLEASNTSNLKEMLGVMEHVRHFESVIRLVQGYDEVLGKAIQKLGEV